MSRWFRHYAGMMRDDKLVRAAMKSKQTVERVLWVWGAVLESAAEVNDCGRFDFDAGEAAYFLRCDESDIGDILAALCAVGRVLDGVVVKWSDRQFDSDKSRDRQKRYRDRLKSSGDGDRDVTQPSRDGQVTLQETETDTNITEANASDAPPAVDARTLVWSDGLSALVSISGKTQAGARAILGKWLKASRDDCALVMSKIIAARDNRVGDPIAWITAALDPPKPARPGVVGAAQRILESENHGSEGIFGGHSHAQFLPPARGDRQRDADEDIFGGAAGSQFSGNH
jgi:hypothetical protein